MAPVCMLLKSLPHNANSVGGSRGTVGSLQRGKPAGGDCAKGHADRDSARARRVPLTASDRRRVSPQCSTSPDPTTLLAYPLVHPLGLLFTEPLTDSEPVKPFCPRCVHAVVWQVRCRRPDGEGDPGSHWLELQPRCVLPPRHSPHVCLARHSRYARRARFDTGTVVKSPDGRKTLRILRRFAFSSQLKRMSVVSMVESPDASEAGLFVAVKVPCPPTTTTLTTPPHPYHPTTHSRHIQSPTPAPGAHHGGVAGVHRVHRKRWRPCC